MAKYIKPERTLSTEEMRQALATGLRDKLNLVAEKFKDLKVREIGKKLGKHELCPLCGNVDNASSCTCLTLSKSEKLVKVSPPGKFKDLPEKLKEKGYSKDSAFAIAWSAKNKADAKKTELEKVLISAHPSTPQVPPTKPTTSAVTVKSPAVKKNAMMGYDSGNSAQGGMATGGAGMAMNEDMKKGELCKNCGKMHDSDGSYDHDLVKEEKSDKEVKIAENKVEKCKTCGSTHKLDVKYGHPLVPNTDSNVPVDDPIGPEAVLPDDNSVNGTKGDEGSGGETKKLAKGFGGAAASSQPHPDTMASLGAVKALAPKAQPKQSLAHLSPIVRANAQMSKFKSIASNPLAMPGNTPLVNPKAMSGHAVSGTIQGKPAVAPAVAKPDALSQVRSQLNTDAKAKPDALQAVRNKMNLEADKKAGGVGWLNSLISRFKKPVAAPIGTGPVRSAMSPSQGLRGIAALARSEKENINLVKSLGDCVLCNKPEHLGTC